MLLVCLCVHGSVNILGDLCVIKTFYCYRLPLVAKKNKRFQEYIPTKETKHLLPVIAAGSTLCNVLKFCLCAM